MLLVFLLTFGLVIAEEIYINKISESLLQKLNYNSINNVEALDSAWEYWEENKKLLSYFINHKELEMITLELKSAHICFEEDERTLYMAYLERAREKIKNLPEY